MLDKYNPQQRTVIIASIVAVIMIIVGLISGNSNILGNLFLVAIVLVVIPPFYYKYKEYQWIKGLEAQFPNFIRDLADSRRSGMSFPESVKLAAKANYGILSREVMTMHNKMSWGIPFMRVLQIFQERTHKSKLINESITIIKESYQAGGDVAATLEAIARDIVMLKETEAERESMLRQNVLIMYGIFFMFLGIAVMIIYVMIPMIATQPEVSSGGFGFAFTNPCEGAGFFPCNVFTVIGIFLEVPDGIANYYVSIFFIVVTIQGVFIGLIAGQIGENSIVAGSKHGLIMVFVGVGVFVFLAKTGLLPV